MYQRNGVFYVQDKIDGKQKSLKTRDDAAARRLFAAMNQAAELPQMNLTMAKAYLAGKSKDMLTRTWQDVMRNMEEAYTGSTLVRWQKQMRCEPFAILRRLPLLDTESSHFLTALQHPRAGTSTHKWLRIVHNRALDLGWLLTPVMARRVWPKLRTKRTKAVTEEQHLRMIAAIKDAEFRHYLEMLWLMGGAQTDTARLHRDNIDLIERRMTYDRQKLASSGKGRVVIAIGEALMNLLSKLPREGYLFPNLAEQTDDVRASRFRKLADRLGYPDISLHSYRYAWAQRAKQFGMPLRLAMNALGHGSKAVHHTYSESAEVVTLPLDFFEKQWKEKIIAFSGTAAA